MKKIAYLTYGDSSSSKVWSGTSKSMRIALEKEYIIVPIDISNDLIVKVTWILPKIVKKIFKKKMPLMKIQSKIFTKRSKKIVNDFGKVDYVFAPAGSNFVTESEGFPPIIYLSDATFDLLVNYYYLHLSKTEIDAGNNIEKRALESASFIIESSEWAKNSVLNEYNIDKKKVNIIPFGANLPDNYIKKDVANVFRLLLVGVSYERKGIDKAIEVIKVLNRISSNNYELSILGLDEISTAYPQNVNFLGKLDKDVPEQLLEIVKIYNDSHLFILPTLADCTPIVFAEACEYGMPIITHDTGGIASYVRNDENGYRLPLSSAPSDFANKIEEIRNDKRIYDRLSQKSRLFFEEEFNWESWLKKIKLVIEKY